MSSRPSEYYSSRGDGDERDRGSSRADRGGAEGHRRRDSRSPSPRRDRDAPIHRGAPTGPSSSRSGARSYEDARQATGPRGSAAGGGRGGFDRGRGGYSNYRGGGGGGYDGGQGGRGGYAGGGGLDYNIRSNRDAPMDRRAIEEGRRQREAERAARREAELDEEARVVEERTIAREKDEKSAAYRLKKQAKTDSRSANASANGSRYATPDLDRKPKLPDTSSPRPDRQDSYVKEEVKEEPEEEDGEMEEDDPDAAAMAEMLGFSGFSTSKNQKRPNAEGAADIKKQRTWRQYMNRRGGFNRPLDPLKK